MPTFRALKEDLEEDLLMYGARLYFSAICEAEDPLRQCMGFLNGMNMFISRPERPKIYLRTANSGRKKWHCLDHLTITIPEGLVLYHYGMAVGRCYDDALY